MCMYTIFDSERLAYPAEKVGVEPSTIDRITQQHGVWICRMAAMLMARPMMAATRVRMHGKFEFMKDVHAQQNLGVLLQNFTGV